MFGAINPAVLIASLMVASVPIMLAAIGELVVEKSGVLNLGVEGMMIIGAICGFITAVSTGSPLLGFAGGAAGGATLALIFAILTQSLLANQVATGLALTLFGLGLSSLMGQGYNGIKPPLTAAVPFGPLRDIPGLGRILFSHDWVVYFSILIIAATWHVLKYTRTGLIIRAVGENHDAAHALGYKVNRIRLACILFGGAMAGMGGAYISLIRVPQWTDGITAGAGWIALAIVVFASSLAVFGNTAAQPLPPAIEDTTLPTPQPAATLPLPPRRRQAAASAVSRHRRCCPRRGRGDWRSRRACGGGCGRGGEARRGRRRRRHRRRFRRCCRWRRRRRRRRRRRKPVGTPASHLSSRSSSSPGPPSPLVPWRRRRSRARRPRVHGRGALAVAVDGGGAAASRRLVL